MNNDMNNDIDIFDSVQRGKFFSFNKIGDAIQGYLVDIYEAIDTYNNQQTVYVLRDKDGILHNVGVKHTNTILLEKLNGKDGVPGVSIGMKVGFRFEDLKQSKKNPNIMAKIIKAYFDPKVFDASLINTKAPEKKQEVQAPVIGDNPEMKEVKESVDRNKMLQDAIITLATTKGLVKAEQSNDEKIQAITKYTGLPITDVNGAAIITKITQYEDIPF